MTARALAWSFRHPGAQQGQHAPGVAVASTGAIATARDDEAVRQAILLLLSTVPGERVMRPEYGCHIDRLVWQPNDDTTAGLAIHYVRQAIERFEPRVEIVELDAGVHPDRDEALEIHLVYRVRASLAQAELRVSIDLAGGTAA